MSEDLKTQTPGGPAAAVAAAFALYQAGDRRGAEAGYRQILRREPDNADALHLLGQLAHEGGKHRDAEILMRRAIELLPGAADFHNNLGAVLKRTGRPAEALPLFRRAIALRADFAEAYNNLGTALESLGDGDAAADAYRRAADLRPDYAGAFTNLAAALEWLGRPQDATAVRRQLVAARPDDAQAHSDLLTGMLYHAGDDAEAVLAEHLRWAQRHERPIRDGRGDGSERTAGALAESRQSGAVERQADVVLSPAPGTPGEGRRGGLDGERPTTQDPLPSPPPEYRGRENLATRVLPAPEKRVGRVLRVGYVSPDFRAHPVVRFFAPLLAYHDRQQFTVTCYSHVARPDAITDQLRRRADHWRDIAAMDDDAAAELIRRDGIDILVDLCGHMPQNRLKLFARKPAPVQVAYLGYPTTTGMQAMDWRITDERLDPFDGAGKVGSALRTDSSIAVGSVRNADPTQVPTSLGTPVGAAGGTDRFHTERLARIDKGCWCYMPDEQGPAVNELPALSGRPFTFAMFNRLVKVTPGMVRAWARILSAVPGSRLLFLTTERGDLQPSTLEGFRQAGFPMDRLISVGRRARPEYMKLFHQADLSLDPFPYAGQTTTCDALWMGVPTVTLAGRTHVARAGLAIMEAVGLGEFVAHSADEYVAIATRWAGALPRLKQLRAGLRLKMSGSPLCDPAGLTRGIEAAYREMWMERCRTPGPLGSRDAKLMD